ncbi:hypothetical protein FOL47_004515, partial [Perkinsus chesapeaki]
DDILGGASCEADAISGQELVTIVGRRHHFSVSEAKSLNTLAYQADMPSLGSQGIEVSPVIKEKFGLSEKAVAESMKEYNNLTDDEAKRKWIRSWAGRFQWLKRWLPHGSHEVLQRLHKLTAMPTSEAEKHVETLCRNYFSGLLSLYVIGGSSQTPVVGSCLVVDTNKDAWSCMLLQIFSIQADQLSEAIPDGPRWLVELDQLTKQVCHGLAVDGNTLSPQEIKRSSTVKERPTYDTCCCSDNKNSSAWWNEIELDYADSEEEYRCLLLYQRTVWVTLWSSRDGCVSYIDAIARGVHDDDNHEDRDIHMGPDPLHQAITTIVDNDQSDQLRVVDEDGQDTLEFVVAPCLFGLDFDLQKAQQGFVKTDNILYREQRFDEYGRLQRQLVSQGHKRTHASGRQSKSWLQRWCWFSKMGTKCRWAKTTCPTCQKVNSEGRLEVPHSTRFPDPKAFKAWYRVGVDGVVIKRGCLFLTATCSFSGYMDFTIINSTDAASFIRGLSILFVRNGYPIEVQSDGEFGSKEIQDWAKSANIKWFIGPPNHGQTGGFYERRHRCLLECLLRWLADVPTVQWDDELLLQNVRWMINHTEIGESQLTPMMIMWGRICELPCMRFMTDGNDDTSTQAVSDPELYDLVIAAGRVNREHQYLTAKFVECWLDERERNHPVLRYDSGLRAGMWVMVYTQRSYKLSPCWRGPYRISAIKSRHVLLTTERGAEFHHVGNCKKFNFAKAQPADEAKQNDNKEVDAGNEEDRQPEPQPRAKRQAAMLSESRTSNLLRDERRAVISKRRRVEELHRPGYLTFTFMDFRRDPLLWTLLWATQTEPRITEQEYKRGDKCDTPEFDVCLEVGGIPCYLAVDSTKRNAIVGLIKLYIPYRFPRNDDIALRGRMRNPEEKGQFGYISRVWVNATYRRQGIATVLVDYGIRRGRGATGTLAMGLFVNEISTAAIELYKKLCFVEVLKEGNEYTFAFYYVDIKAGPTPRWIRSQTISFIGNKYL